MSVGNPNALNNWYHCIGSTYGTWLPGDPRGFRTYHHKQHVEGDYKNPPPPGMYKQKHAKSKQRLTHPPVYLDPQQRQRVCQAMIGRLQGDGVEVVALAVASNHFHLLARFPMLSPEQRKQLSQTLLKDGRDPSPRHHLGRARKHAAMILSQAHLKDAGPVWAQRPKCDPIHNRDHQCRVARYIVDHRRSGAAVWQIASGFLYEDKSREP